MIRATASTSRSANLVALDWEAIGGWVRALAGAEPTTVRDAIRESLRLIRRADVSSGRSGENE